MKANNPEQVLRRPRMTEKSSLIYTFEVAPDATKPEIRKAVAHIYKVTPTRVNIINTPAKQIFYRGRTGKKSGLKKALVYLKPGDKIEFV